MSGRNIQRRSTGGGDFAISNGFRAYGYQSDLGWSTPRKPGDSAAPSRRAGFKFDQRGQLFETTSLRGQRGQGK